MLCKSCFLICFRRQVPFCASRTSLHKQDSVPCLMFFLPVILCFCQETHSLFRLYSAHSQSKQNTTTDPAPENAQPEQAGRQWRYRETKWHRSACWALESTNRSFVLGKGKGFLQASLNNIGAAVQFFMKTFTQAYRKAREELMHSAERWREFCIWCWSWHLTEEGIDRK